MSHFPLSTGQIFKLISPHENNIKIFQLKYISILHIKRQQKITQAKVFENFTSRQHALLHNLCVVMVERGQLGQAKDCLARAHAIAPDEEYITRHLDIVVSKMAENEAGLSSGVTMP